MKKSALKALLAGCIALPLAAPAFAQDTPITGNIVMTPTGEFNRSDIKLSDNAGGFRIIAAPTLNPIHEGAAIQFFGSNHAVRPGYAFIDSGSHDQAAIVLRTAPTGVAAIDRFKITAQGNIGIGVANPTQKLDILGSIKINGAGNGIIFADGTTLTSSAGGLSMNNNRITNVGQPTDAGDAVNKVYVDANFVKFVPGAEQLSVGDANGTAPMINLRGGSTCCSGPGGHTPAWF